MLIVLLLLKHQCSLLWSYSIKIWKVMETCLTIICMIAMMYNKAVMHTVLFHWNRLGFFFNCLFLSSSKIETFSVCDLSYDVKFCSILLLVNLQLCPYLNHGWSGAVEPLRNSFTCNLSSTCIQAVTSGTWSSFKMILWKTTWPSYLV